MPIGENHRLAHQNKHRSLNITFLAPPSSPPNSTGFTMTNKTSERPLLQHKNGSTHGNNTNKTAVFLGPSDPGIVPLGVVKNTDTASKSRSPSKKSNSRKMMLKDLSEAVRGMLDDAGYVFSDEYEVIPLSPTNIIWTLSQ